MEMDSIQAQAWEWLLPIEQNSLFLILGTGKTSWEVGEMLNISHYKYIELRERSETFFKMFYNFLQKHPHLFRPDGPCQEEFKDYMEALICHRKTRKEAILHTGSSVNLLNEVNMKKVELNINRLKLSDDEWDRDTLKLIQEFDRWNNFRILPKMLQLPSAYKRRLNKRHKIYINYLLNSTKMPEWLIERIKERFYFKTNKEDNKWYISLISTKVFPEMGYSVISVKKDPEVLKDLTKFYIYVFSSKEDADSFGFKIANYKIQTSRVRLGQRFWPEYREIVERAINYKFINNLDFDMKILEKAYKKLS